MNFHPIALAVGTLCRGLNSLRCLGSYHIQPILVRVRRQR